MDLIADRFLRFADGPVVDVATARAVTWRALGALAHAADERRWSAACGTLAGLWHQDLPPLVDFGRLPDGSRYEAFEMAPSPARRFAPGSGALAFLRDAGLADGAGEGGPFCRRSAPRASIGIHLIRRAALDRIAELLDEACAGRPIVVGYVAEPGGGVTTLLRAAAREATARGFVPVSVRAMRRWPALERSVGERHVLLLASRDEARDDGPERALVRLALASSRGHVLLRPARPGTGELRVALEALDPDALARAVHVSPRNGRTRRAIAQAAEQSGGQPGRFVALLGAQPAPTSHRLLRVAEARPEYRISVAPAAAPDVAHWIQRGDEAMRLAANGRHAIARRMLFEASAALRRRGQHLRGARVEIGLGRLLLAHGEAESAESVFRRSHADLDEGDAAAAVEAVAGVGAALIERGSLESAEALLRAAREQSRGTAPCLLLARCLAWQARYDEAERALTPALEASEPIARGEALTVLARIALGRHALPDAGRAASLALAELEGRAASEARAETHELLALLQARVADFVAAQSHASLAFAAARQARLPLRAVSIRLVQLEAAHRCRVPVPGRLVAHFERLADGGLPALPRARIAAVLAQAHPCEKKRAAYASRTEAFVRVSGAKALAGEDTAAGAAVAQDASALIGLLAREPDPRRLLESTAEWLRARLVASAVAVFDHDDRPIVTAGRAGAFTATRRALVTRQAIPPYLSENGIEAAAPIEYAGEAAGVLGVRWPIDRQPPAAATCVMVTGASCAGPAVQALRDRLAVGPRDIPPNGIVGGSVAIVRLHDAIRRAGACPFPVLVEGESGAGKELVAKALHGASPRRVRPFQAVNCAAFQDDLFEAELFGHARGAFTGAYTERPGLFEQADGGTLFLDEISELTPRAQAKLLRVLQEGEIKRVGENASRRVDVRVIAASNRPLDQDVKSGRFRQDLLFRIAVIRVAVPALRDRREDIPLLAAYFWKDAAARTGSRATLASGAVAALARYDWPGNVRELQNVIAALAVQVTRGRVEAADVEALVTVSPSVEARTLEEARRAFERAHVGAALARAGGRHAQAARELGLSRQGLAKLLRRLSIDWATARQG